MNRPIDTLQTFYHAFLALDARKMSACYAADARFADPLMRVEGRDGIGSMWQMLCDAIVSNGRADWRLLVGELQIEGERGHVHWEPKYRFGSDDQRVHNLIDSSFTFNEQGLIASQHDRYDLWRWSRQALGTRGTLLGWMPWFRARLRERAARHLEAWMLARRGGA